MSLVSKYFRRSVELVVIRNIFNPQEGMQYFRGHDVESLLKQAFGGGLSENVRLYHGDISKDVTPKTPADVDKIMRLDGRIYAVVKPMGVETLIAVAISIAVSVAVAFLMPVPNVPTQGQTPSPNNALASRTNRQRLGGRVPDIFGTVYSVPDLLAVTYSIYIDHKEVEYSYYCIGRGKHHVFDAFDDTTPIRHVSGSSLLVYDPDTTLDDEPAFQFGASFTPDEAFWSRIIAKRYTAVNGQDLPYPDKYKDKSLIFRSPNIVEVLGSFDGLYKAGETIQIEGADDLESANGILDSNSDPVYYNLSGTYEIVSIGGQSMTLLDPYLVNTDWQKLTSNSDYTVAKTVTISREVSPLWQGWFYTSAKDHNAAIINILAPAGLYFTEPDGDVKPMTIRGVIESEVVDSNDNAVSGTLVSQVFEVKSPAITRGNYSANVVMESAAATIGIENPNYTTGKRIRVRLSRTTVEQGPDNRNQESQDIKIADFYSYRQMTASDYPKGVTHAIGKTLATEGALSLKERKLRLLVQRYVTDATTGILKLSNRVDDIIRHIATDPKIGNLDLSQIDMAQIKAEIDTQIAYFGTDKCAEFCYTFDDTNLSAEETIQTVARAAFCQASRNGNKIMLEFERKTVAAKAIFNSHNILPNTFKNPKSYGVIGDYDGVKVEYTDPADDATVTLSYPSDNLINPHEDKLIGVRNKVQAHIHAMRLLNRDLHTYKSCEFTAGDESNIVVRTNRITAVDQLRADVQQGSVHAIETIGSDIVLHTTDPVTIDDSVPHTLFIQTINNGVESIPVTARDDYSVILARLPSGEISSGYDVVVQATYEIASNANAGRDDYIVTEKSPSEGMTNGITATNYDDRFYDNDKDFINGLIT